jgi:hypothetical protein
MPEVPLSPETLGCLLAPAYDGEVARHRGWLAPVKQACYGSRDLVFGGKYYRPEQVGWNDHADVTCLAADLAGIDPAVCDVADLLPLRGMASEAETEEELEFVREWFPALRELYQQAQAERNVVICERL